MNQKEEEAENLLDLWSMAQLNTVDAYKIMIDRQAVYDNLSAEYYEKGKPKNGIQDIIVKHHNKVYTDLIEAKKNYKDCCVKESIAKGYYYESKREKDKLEQTNKSINSNFN